jgi:hypothetical protein
MSKMKDRILRQQKIDSLDDPEMDKRDGAGVLDDNAEVEGPALMQLIQNCERQQ